MIFRITVNDNDFTYALEDFANSLFSRVYWVKKRTNDMSASEWYEKCYEPKEEIRRLMNPNITTNLTMEDKALLRTAVFSEWCDFVDQTFADQDDRKYLKQNFVVSVGFNFKDKWENGEVLYYFTTNQKWITQ